MRPPLGLGPKSCGIGRNAFRYPDAWKADLRLGKKFSLSDRRDLELLAESFNLFNHQNVTKIDTTGYEIKSGTSTSLPQICYLAINATGGDSCETESVTSPGPFLPAFGSPLNINGSNFYRERQIELGTRLRF